MSSPPELSQLSEPVQHADGGSLASLEQDATQSAIPTPPEGQPSEDKRERQVVNIEREPGKTLFPFSRVQRIIKADRDLPMVAKEATFLISIAAEEFIKHIIESSRRFAEREKRATIQQRDVANVVRTADEFMFLEEIIPFTTPDQARKKPKTLTSQAQGSTTLDLYMASKRNDSSNDGLHVVMNEDGTMATGEIA